MKCTIHVERKSLSALTHTIHKLKVNIYSYLFEHSHLYNVFPMKLHKIIMYNTSEIEKVEGKKRRKHLQV